MGHLGNHAGESTDRNMMDKKTKKLKKGTSTKTPKEESERAIKKRDKHEQPTYCPVCGQELVDEPSGLWCVNPDCEVTDDCYLCRKNDDR
jgi:hypothetical protein